MTACLLAPSLDHTSRSSLLSLALPHGCPQGCPFGQGTPRTLSHTTHTLPQSWG